MIPADATEGLTDARRAFVLAFRFTNNLTQLPTWSYDDYRYIYCTEGYTIPGERKPLIGALFLLEYTLYVCFYFPVLLVIARPPFINQPCYKIMLCVGIADNMYTTFCVTLVAGILQLMGANYCDNTRLLIYVGHIGHACWFMMCAFAVLLSVNRYMEFAHPQMSERLFAGE